MNELCVVVCICHLLLMWLAFVNVIIEIKPCFHFLFCFLFKHMLPILPTLENKLRQELVSKGVAVQDLGGLSGPTRTVAGNIQEDTGVTVSL